MHIYSARDGEHKVCDYVGLTPAAADMALYTEPAQQARGPLSPLVPGACAGWLEALRRYGSMDAAAVFAPAIELAEGGFPLTVKNAWFFNAAAEALRQFPSSAGTYLVDGRSPEAGEVLVQQDLAETFRTLAADGPDAFYGGAIGDAIAAFMAESGGLLTKQDLAANRPAWLDPVGMGYRDWTVFAPAPPCQAVQYLETLKILEGFDIGAMGHNTAETLHTFIEAVKLACIDRIHYTAIEDPPTSGLLSEDYAAERRRLIGPQAAVHMGNTFRRERQEGEVGPGDPRAWIKTECTTHFDTIDAAGNAVACTQSLGSGFGSAMVVPGTGVALNNFMNWFDDVEGSPQRHRTVEEERDVRISGPGLGPGWTPPAHRHAGIARHPADHPADDHERPRPRHERAGRHRGAAPHRGRDAAGRCRVAGVLGGARRARGTRPPVPPPRGLVPRRRRRPGHPRRSGLRCLHGRRRPAPGRLRSRLLMAGFHIEAGGRAIDVWCEDCV